MARQPANRKPEISLQFPMGGLDESSAYQQQPPYTSRDLQNVRPDDPIEGRSRGGSRPGLTKFRGEQLGSGANVWGLDHIDLVQQGATAYPEKFSSLGVNWENDGAWRLDFGTPGILPSVFSDGGLYYDYSIANPSCSVVNESLDIDTSSAYAIEWTVAPNPATGLQEDVLYGFGMRAVSGSPDFQDSGVQLILDLLNGDGTYTGTVRSDGSTIAGGSISGTVDTKQPFVVRIHVSGTTINVYIDGTQKVTNGTIDNHGTQKTIGLAMNVSNTAGTRGVVRGITAYYTPTPALTGHETKILSVSNGALYHDVLGAQTQVAGSKAYSTDRRIRMAQYGLSMYIADNGEPTTSGTDGATNAAPGTTFTSAAVGNWETAGVDADDHVLVIDSGTGLTAGVYNISSVSGTNMVLATSPGASGTAGVFRVVPAYMVYDGTAGTQAKWLATSGSVPMNCSLITRWMGRIVLAGDYNSPTQWYMSRINDPLDFDYADETIGAATSGANAPCGVPGQPITALFSIGDDYLVMASRTQLWVMTGDPTAGGRLDELSRDYGVISGDAWCRGDNDEIYFLSEAGLYMCQSAKSKPQPMSYQKLPRRLRGLGADVSANLAFDVLNQGVHVFLISRSGGRGTFTHYWWDKRTQGWFPVVLGDTTQEPTSIHTVQGKAILGCRDGYLREFNDWSSKDDGTNITAYFDIGPLQLGGAGGRYEGVIEEMYGTIGQNSGDVTMEIYTGNTPDTISTTAFSGTPITLSAGRSFNHPVRARAGAHIVRINGSSSLPFAFESLGAKVSRRGRLRA